MSTHKKLKAEPNFWFLSILEFEYFRVAAGWACNLKVLDALQNELPLLVKREAVRLEDVWGEEGLQILYPDLSGPITEGQEGTGFI